jgi:hypothetical protein
MMAVPMNSRKSKGTVRTANPVQTPASMIAAGIGSILIYIPGLFEVDEGVSLRSSGRGWGGTSPLI